MVQTNGGSYISRGIFLFFAYILQHESSSSDCTFMHRGVMEKRSGYDFNIAQITVWQTIVRVVVYVDEHLHV